MFKTIFLNLLNKERIALIAIIANIILALFKITIGLMSKSSSVLASGLDSATDIISSGISFFGIWLSKKPADKEHPYGHHKFEVLSGLIITIILFSTGIWILYEAYFGFFATTHTTNSSTLALIIMGFSAIVNEIMARAKIYYGKKEQSISLISDGVHSRLDMISSIAVFVGLIISPFFIYIDSLLTFLIGLFIIKQAFSLGKDALDSLLDASAGEEIEGKIRKIVQKNNITLMDLKTQKKGAIVTANLEINLPKKLSVEEATTISKQIREQLINEINPLEYVIIQLKSHDSTEAYFNPKDIFSKFTLKKGFGWQKKGKFKEKVEGAKGKGPKGYCVCPKCNFKIKHKQGVPCSTLKCPNCNYLLTRGE